MERPTQEELEERINILVERTNRGELTAQEVIITLIGLVQSVTGVENDHVQGLSETVWSMQQNLNESLYLTGTILEYLEEKGLKEEIDQYLLEKMERERGSAN